MKTRTTLLAALPIAAALVLAPLAHARDRDWRGGHWDGWHGNPGWHGDSHHHGGDAAAAAIIGGLVGLGLGAALANQYPAYAPPPVAYPPYYGYAPGYRGY
ncbi:MAG: hypothetical protein JO047_12905 [Alphaproteobacteria bacterium]|nr:hypothetical protein [Alphaproteobacteria bacterium]